MLAMSYNDATARLWELRSEIWQATIDTFVMMGISTVAIGLLPTYETIGILAPLLLALARFGQGLGLGGEWGGAALMSVEHAPADRRGLFGSFTQVGSSAGMLLATGAFSLVKLATTDEQFAAFGWRLPFLASGLLVVVGLAIRLGVEDSAEFRVHRDAGTVSRAPVVELLRHHARPVLVTAGLRLGQNGLYYLVTAYLVSYLVLRGADDGVLVSAIMVASAIGLVSTPFWGAVSDRVGRARVSRVGYALTAVAGWVLFAVVDAGALAVLPLVVVLVINVAHDSVYGPQAAWFAEQFPVRVRYSGVNLGYQLGTVVGGGFAPFIAALLYEVGGHTPWLIAAYLTLLATLSLIASRFARDPVARPETDLVADDAAILAAQADGPAVDAAPGAAAVAKSAKWVPKARRTGAKRCISSSVTWASVFRMMPGACDISFWDRIGPIFSSRNIASPMMTPRLVSSGLAESARTVCNSSSRA